CLTCGARNEHVTRSCPISKVCFTCGMKGHINATCPNRRAIRGTDVDRYNDCDRCGSQQHKMNECPTWWRLYEYVTDKERSSIIRVREEKKDLTLGAGGESYISSDPWCYNCGDIGHWGDDCEELPHRHDIPVEPSAFSLNNMLSGPFYDSTEQLQSLSNKDRCRSEIDKDTSEWLQNLPDEVGKQGRKKHMERMEKRAREQEQVEEDDWFGNSTNLRIRGQ
ncbi:hypothetical protein AMATHDRAFT_107883, partial [Amanita thiersii Skay4041]